MKISSLAKLTVDEVRAIRRIWKKRTMTQAEIAARFHVGQATISNLIRKKVYKSV